MERPPTEAPHPHSTYLDRLSALDIVRVMNGADRAVADAVGRQAPAIAHAIDAIAGRLRAAGRLFYIGAGSSGRLGVLDAAECPSTFGVSPEMVRAVIAGGAEALTRAVEGAEDRREDGVRDVTAAGLAAGDVVVGIAASGRTPYVLGAIEFARSIGVLTVGITAVPGSELTTRVEIAIVPETGPEILTGSTRLKAGTAAKLVLNMLSTGAMVRLGRTYGNRMVDLVATNVKLRARALAMVREIAGCAADTAARALDAAGFDVKAAIVIARCGDTVPEARHRLDSAGGRLRDVLEMRAGLPAGEANEPALVIGVDGGASKTVAWLAPLARDAAPIGRGTAGPGNPRSVGSAEAEAHIDQAIDAAFADAGLPRRAVAVAGFSLAGVGRADEREGVAAWATRAAIAHQVVVTDDAESVLVAGAPEGWGIALICGTGTLAIGRNEAGDVERAGGWGYLLGDEGSAYAIALAGLRAALRAADGRGPVTSLMTAFLAHFDVAKPADLVGQIYRAEMTRDRLAALATVVFAEAPDDWTAAGIVDAACADLVRLVTTIATRLALARETYPLALAGSVLSQQPLLQQLLVDNLRAGGLGPKVVRVVADPAAGAVAIARRAALD